MRVTVLGSASGISMPGRGHTCVALECGRGLYLFDLGEPVGREILARGLPVASLKAAFVSHMHSDHAGGLFQLLKNLHLYHNHPRYLPQVDRVTIALPAEAVDAVKAFSVAMYMFAERMKVRVDYLPISAGPLYRDENIRVTARATAHMDEYRDLVKSRPEYAALKCEAFSFEVFAEGRRIVYSGDLGSIDDILAVARGADLVVLEFGHLLPLEENLARLAGLGIGRIILTHIFPDYNDRKCELQASADGVLPGLVAVADDGLAVTL